MSFLNDFAVRRHARSRQRPAFTLAELLLSMGIIGVLSTVVIAAVGPREALLKARDAQRTHNVKQLMNAFNQDTIAGTGGILHADRLGTGTGWLATPICIEGMTRDRSCINIDSLVESGILNGIPQDTAEPCPTLSGYAAYLTDGHVQIVADHRGKLRGDITINRCLFDTVSPDIFNINELLSADEVRFTWETDEPAIAFVQYGKSGQGIEANSTTASDLLEAHEAFASALESFTKYDYRIVARDKWGNVTVSAQFSFTTGDTVAPELTDGPWPETLDRTATITWSTNEPADSQIDYGLAADDYDSQSDLFNVDPRVTDHAITLIGLSPETIYHYRVLSEDASGNRLLSTDYTFTTLPDETDPVLEVGIPVIDGRNITFTWTTNEDARSSISYIDEDGNTIQTDWTNNPGLNHSITIENLTYEKLYTFQLKSQDDAGNTGIHPTSYVIEDLDHPVISDLDVQTTYHSATITWTTDEPATARLSYALPGGSWTTASDTSGTDHTVTLSGLSFNRTYLYTIYVTDLYGNDDTTEEANFLTKHVIKNIALNNVTDSSVRVTWQSEIAAQGLVSWYLCPTAGCPVPSTIQQNQWNGHTAYGGNGTSHSRDITGLLAGRTYVLRPVLRWDTPHRWAVDYATVTMQADSTAPIISGVGLVDARRNIPTPTIRWNTNEMANSRVEWGLTNAYGNDSGVFDTAPMKTTGHSFTFPDLPMNTRIHVKLWSSDAAGNPRSYATSFETDDIAPSLVSGPTVTGITGNTATIRWTVDEASNALVYYGTASGSLTSHTGWSHNWTQPHLFSTSQTRSLTNLQPGTTYYYRAYSRDAAAGSAGAPVNQWRSDILSFTTIGDITPPVISNVSVTNRNTPTPTITWNTNELANSRIQWGLSTAYNNDSGVFDAAPMKTSGHRFVFPTLPMNDQIFIKIYATDAAGNTGTFTSSFWTDDIPPVLTSGPSVSFSNETTAVINWTVNESARGRVLYSRHPTLASGVTYTSFTPYRTSLSRTLYSLTRETTYYYRLQSQDGAGNTWTSPDVYSFHIDRTPPVLSNLTVTPVNGTTVTVAWNTNEPATARIEYGTTSTYGSVATDASLTTNPGITLSNLLPNTLYHFRIRSTDAAGNLSNYSTNQTFTTSDTDPPEISSVVSSAIADTQATITWNTDEPATSRVEYGTTTALGTLTTLNTEHTTAHSQVLTNLQKGTRYYFRVLSVDAAGNGAALDGTSFVTTNTTPPTISGIQISGRTETSLTIVWNTSEPADSQIVYSTDQSFNQSTTISPTLVTAHSRQITGLQPDTPYYYKVRSRNNGGILAESPMQEATTAADQTAPIISAVSHTSAETTATITWTTDEPADSRVIYGTNITFGSQSDLLNTSPRVTSHSVTLTDLTPGQQYYYRVQSSDANGNPRESITYSVTPIDVTPPQITEGPTVTAVTATTATIAWTTNEETDARVKFGEGPFYELGERTDPTMATSHVFLVTNIGAVGRMITYNALVSSFDRGLNSVISANFTFTTDGVAPVLSGVSPPSVTGDSVTYTWSTNEPATSRIECESTETGQLSAQSLVLTSSHNLTLTGLRAGTTFICRVLSMDRAQNIGTANAGSFTTPALAMSVPSVTAGSTAATFTWTSNFPTVGTIDYGTTDMYGTQITGLSSLSHSLSTSAPLAPGTLYHYRTRSTDAWGQFVEQTGTFTTQP